VVAAYALFGFMRLQQPEMAGRRWMGLLLLIDMMMI
jgi:hypothetical protein